MRNLYMPSNTDITPEDLKKIKVKNKNLLLNNKFNIESCM